MTAIFFFNYCFNMPSKRFSCVQNKFFRHFIPFFLKALVSKPIFRWEMLHDLLTQTPLRA